MISRSPTSVDLKAAPNGSVRLLRQIEPPILGFEA